MSRFLGEAEQPKQASRVIQDATRWPPRRWEQKELMQALWLSKIEAQRDGLRRTGILPGPQSCSSTPTLDCSCCPRSANSRSIQCRGIGCIEARVLLEPGPSFCWGPALEGPTSPSSSRSSTPGKVDEIDARCAARAPCPPLQAPQPPRAHPTHQFRRLAPPTHRLHASQSPHP